MPVLLDAKPVHARWSEANREFLEFVERNPMCLDRTSFASIYECTSLREIPIQPWPLFIGRQQRLEVEGIALGMDRLFKDVLERFLGNDPKRIVEFYRTRSGADGGPSDAYGLNEEMVTLLLWEPSGVWSAPSRADYIETPEGLKCIEYNAGGNLGGLQTDGIGELYLDSAPVSCFLRERDRRARAPGVLRAFFRHLVEDTAGLGVWETGAFNVAMVVRPHNLGWTSRHSAEVYTRELHRALGELGCAPEGRVLLCSLDEIEQAGSALTLQGHRLHAVVEQHNGEGDIRPVFRAFKAGSINFFSGPIADILSDKRNQVLLSEHAGSDEFTSAERSLIERHVPWTRRVLPSRTTFRGHGIRLPDDLVARRGEFVLKKASSVGGDFVAVGRFCTDEAWRETILQALRDGDWVVQEYLETVPYCFQSGDAGATRHDMVWGLFAFGDHFGGIFLRMRPMGQHGGVVNTRQGAEIGAVLEIME